MLFSLFSEFLSDLVAAVGGSNPDFDPVIAAYFYGFFIVIGFCLGLGFSSGRDVWRALNEIPDLLVRFIRRRFHRSGDDSRTDEK